MWGQGTSVKRYLKSKKLVRWCVGATVYPFKDIVIVYLNVRDYSELLNAHNIAQVTNCPYENIDTLYLLIFKINERHQHTLLGIPVVYHYKYIILNF